MPEMPQTRPCGKGMKNFVAWEERSMRRPRDRDGKEERSLIARRYLSPVNIEEPHFRDSGRRWEFSTETHTGEWWTGDPGAGDRLQLQQKNGLMDTGAAGSNPPYASAAQSIRYALFSFSRHQFKFPIFFSWEGVGWDHQKYPFDIMFLQLNLP
jgi:hypothetical protein